MSSELKETTLDPCLFLPQRSVHPTVTRVCHLLSCSCSTTVQLSELSGNLCGLVGEFPLNLSWAAFEQ